MSSGLDITPVVPAGKQVIGGYGDGAFTIGGRLYTGAVLVFPESTVTWQASDPARLNVDSFQAVQAATDAFDILLVGCGPAFVPPPKGLRMGLKEQGLVMEWMDTGAACRTFNVLLAEGRPTAAALLPVSVS